MKDDFSKTYAEAINSAFIVAMKKDPTVVCYGLGVTDPKGVFGTTMGLETLYGSGRVFDMPTSENAMTGVAIGLAISGFKAVMTHQRLDFFLLAMDQLVNGAAKYHYMYGSQVSVPITIRLIIGRGWGQGPTHSQNLQAWFAHIPGLKVVMPTNPHDAKGLLLESIFDPNPVIFLEHRWLHNMIGDVPSDDFRVPIGVANVLTEGSDVTLVAMSYLVVEAQKAESYLRKNNIKCEVLDLRTIKPLDWDAIFRSVRKTGRLLVLDTGAMTGSISGEIVARVVKENFHELKVAPERLAMPDVPEPTSRSLTEKFYLRASDIAVKVTEMLGQENSDQIRRELPDPKPHDVPGTWFTGPF